MLIDALNVKIWVLVDDRVGNANQAIELAEALGHQFEIKTIKYNFLAALPSFLLSDFSLHVKKHILSNLCAQKPPDIIISSGRRTSILAAYLKQIFHPKKHVKIVQIMRPGINCKKFDLIILPQHDKFDSGSSNVIRMIGALTNVLPKIDRGLREFEIRYPQIENCIALVVGGAAKNYRFRLEDAKLLVDTVLNIWLNYSLPLFITFSRRTPEPVKAYFKNTFGQNNANARTCFISDPQEGLYNPYPAMLAKAEYIICTPDSISMCSEAVSTGKPVYIFYPDHFKLKKHKFFIQQLVDLGIAKLLDTNAHSLTKYDYQPLAEIKKIALIIQKKLL